MTEPKVTFLVYIFGHLLTLLLYCIISNLELSLIKEMLHFVLKPYSCYSFHEGKSARSLQTSWPRIAVHWATHGRFPSWIRASKAAWPTSALSLMALAHQPFVLPWPRCRTTSMRLWSRWTKCTLMQPETHHKAPQMETAKLWTRWTSTGSKASKLRWNVFWGPKSDRCLVTFFSV